MNILVHFSIAHLRSHRLRLCLLALIGSINISTTRAGESSSASPAISNLVKGWTLVIDDNFSRQDTTPPESIGAPGLYHSPSVGGEWIDSSKSWKLSKHTLVPTVAGKACEGHGATGPVRPSQENSLNQGVEITTGPMPVSDTVTTIPYAILLRIVPGSGWGTCYNFTLKLNPRASTATVVVGPAGQWGSFAGTEGQTFPVVAGHSYVFTATARSLYLGGFTILSYTVADKESPRSIINSGQSAIAAMRASWLSNPGAVGIQQERSDLTRSDLAVITRFRSFIEPESKLRSLSNPLVISTTGNIVTISGDGTKWTPDTPEFTLSGLQDCQITSQEILSPVLARLTIATGSFPGQLRISESSSGGSCELAVSAVAAPLLATNLIPQQDTAKTVRILGGIATGGRAPYSYQWHRSTNWSFIPDDGTKIAGATQLDLLDTPPDDQCYAYKLVVTDSTSGTPRITTSPAAPGMRNWVIAPNPVFKPTSTKIPALRIGWIGDSITAPGTRNVIITLSYLKAAGIRVTSSTNCGVPGSQSSADGKGWNPAATADQRSGTNLYSAAIAELKQADANVIMLMLGSNEANGLAYTQTYLANINAILAQLAIDLPGVPVILNTPALATRVIGGCDANETHIAFVGALDQAAAANPNALRGDRNMPVWSYGRYHEYNDDIHPNAAGMDSYARYWADTLIRHLQSKSHFRGLGVLPLPEK